LLNTFQKICWTIFFTLFFSFSLFSGYNFTHKKIPSEKHPLIFLSTDLNDDLKDALISSINTAKETITLLSYSITDKEVINSLIHAAKRGVQVEIFADKDASRGLEKKLTQEIALYFRGSAGLMHHKILIIDKKIVWMGSANFTFASLRRHQNMMVGIDSQEIAKQLLKKVNGWKNKAYLAIEKSTHTIHGQNLTFYYLPDNEHAEKKLLSLINGAKKTIRVAIYTFTRNDVADALIAAHKKGVNTIVYIDKGSGEGAGQKIYRKLIDAGVPTKLYDNQGLLHHKMAWIDHNKLIMGSANWTHAAFSRNEDNFFILEPLNKEQNKMLKKVFKQIDIFSN
jgi:cardiolipin synthase A/B